MRTFSAFALGLWLTAAMGLPAGAQPTLPQGPSDRPCDQPPGAAAPRDPAGHALMATIKGVNHQQGIIELDSKDGRFLLATSLAEIQGLREGDLLLVCLEGDALEGEERLADTLF